MVTASDAADRARADLHASHADALHVAAVKITNAIEDRDVAIRAAFADGMPAPAIASAVGLTRSRVYQIVTGGDR